MKRVLILILTFIIYKGNAQGLYKGYVLDSLSKNPLINARVENSKTHKGITTDIYGYFELEAIDNEFLIISMLGYKNKYVNLTSYNQDKPIMIYLAIKPVQLKDVVITKGPTKYQIDSARNASLYKSIIEYEQQKSVFSPVTSAYQKFSKKHRNIRKFKSQMETMEKQKFIDSRYNAPFVMELTQMNEEEAQLFINKYPIEYDFARAASDVELKLWIKYYYKQYQAQLTK